MPAALVIRTRRGRPYTKDILAKDIRTVRRLAGLPGDLQLRDLRRTATIEHLCHGNFGAVAAGEVPEGWQLGGEAGAEVQEAPSRNGARAVRLLHAASV